METKFTEIKDTDGSLTKPDRNARPKRSDKRKYHVDDDDEDDDDDSKKDSRKHDKASKYRKNKYKEEHESKKYQKKYQDEIAELTKQQQTSLV